MHRQYALKSLALIRVEHFLNRLINILILINRFVTPRIMSSSSISRSLIIWPIGSKIERQIVRFLIQARMVEKLVPYSLRVILWTKHHANSFLRVTY